MFDDESITFQVVANHQEQYSIWPDFKDIPAGWIAVGPRGSREECLDYIERVWTDMRPKSLRDKMQAKDEHAEDVSEQIQEAIQSALSSHADRVKEYSEQRPELYGWFVAQVFTALEDAAPDEIRRGLDAQLPPHNIPEGYA